MAMRRRQSTILLPGERPESRRSFLKKGLLGGALLLAGGGAWFGTRRTVVPGNLGGPFRVFAPEEAAVLVAVADRLVPPRTGFPRPASLGIATRIDAVAAQADVATQTDLRRLVRLFESSLAGLFLDGSPRRFTESAPEQQDRRLAAWARSRFALRRTGHRALRRLTFAAYYTAPETWAAVGYPGPPIRPSAGREARGG